MLDTVVTLGFMGKEVKEALDDSMAIVHGITRTGKFYYIEQEVLLKRKSTGELFVGIYEEEKNGKRYVWCRVYKSLLKILLSADDVEVI